MNVLDYFPLRNGPFNGGFGDEPNGRWLDSTGIDEEYIRYNFVEVHPSATWVTYEATPERRKVVVRISVFDCWKVRMGDCVVLDKRQITELRDHLNDLLKEM